MKHYSREVDVEGPATYQDVSVEHPDIVSGIENLVKQGRNNEYICRVIGMPPEVVDRVRHRLRQHKV